MFSLSNLTLCLRELVLDPKSELKEIRESRVRVEGLIVEAAVHEDIRLNLLEAS